MMDDAPPAKKLKLDESESVNTSTSKKAELKGPVLETDVGICCYITSGFTPITGIVKQRFSDFVVNEVDTEGKVVHLTSISTEDCDDSATTVSDNTSTPSTETASQELASPEFPLPTSIVNDLKIMEAGSSEIQSVKFEAPQEKMVRKRIHNFVQSQFPSLCSNCITENDVKYLEFNLKSSNKNKDPRNRTDSWPKDRPQHLHFVLYKEFKDTMEAIDIISKYSGIKPQQFNYAGTKDRRAKTSQRISAHKVTSGKLHAINAKLRGMAMGNFKYLNERIVLGQLTGNRFKIVLRNVETTTENLEKATESLRQSGFINYFGMQRFGTGSVPTYQVGLHILKSEYDKAIDLIMAPRSTDKPHVASSRLLWHEKRDAKAVLNKLPRSFNIERRLMEGVVKCGVTNFLGALERIPRTTRLLYLHSYQSLIWNKAASLRVEKFGLKPIVGDLVFVEEAAMEPDVTEISEDREDEQVWESRNKSVVKHLTENDLDKYTIYDIIIPLPGYNVVLPDNEVKEAITRMLAEDNLTLESLKCKKKSKQYRLPGSYRRVVIKPDNLTSSLTYYDDVTEELVLSDMDILNKKVLSDKGEGAHQAVVLEFGLPSSCYATMLLRELMRIDTSAAHQTSLNVP